jgi:hypothetical protein
MKRITITLTQDQYLSIKEFVDNCVMDTEGFKDQIEDYGFWRRLQTVLAKAKTV